MKWGFAGTVVFCAYISVWALTEGLGWTCSLWAFLAFVNSLSTYAALQREAVAG